MKRVLTLFTLVSSVSLVSTAFASDRKIGNVIAVERTLNNVYQSCIAQIKDSADKSSFQACAFNPKSGPSDSAPGKQSLLHFNNKVCTVEAQLQNNVIFVTYQSLNPKATLEHTKACLRDALDSSPNKDSFKFLMHTVE